jgi:LPS-assembly lipoprotein
MLAGCGWHPMYGATDSSSPRRTLARIDVALIPERSGQLLREALQAEFEGSGQDAAPEYRLVTQYSVSQEGLGIETDSAITRYRMIGTATYVLSAVDGVPRTCASGTVRQLDGFDVANEQFFAVDLAAETVQRRLAKAVAADIATRLTLSLAPASGQSQPNACAA